MSPSFPIIFLHRYSMLRSVLSVTLGAVLLGILQEFLNEVLLAPAGGLDGRRLLDGLGAAAGKEEDTAEHGAEDTDRKLLCANMSAVVLDSICLPSFHCREMCCAVRPCRILLMIAPKGSVVRELDVRSESRPCRW